MNILKLVCCAFIASICLMPPCFAQVASSPELDRQPELLLRKTQDKIVIDGVPDEAAWFSGEHAQQFWENFPQDSSRSEWPTEIYMTFDETNLYIAAKCYSPGEEYIIPSLKRDYRAGGSDNITFLIDPFRDKTNAFVFGVNPYGVVREALIANGGNSFEDWSDGWDNKWRGEASIQADHWSCEIAIPFSTLRFPKGQTEWYFNSYRFDTQSNTISSWNRIPRNQIIMNLAYMGRMRWEEAPQSTGKSISVIPYVTGGVQKNFEDNEPTNSNFNIGGDAKVSLTSGLNLDLTANPDFSQVEVDRQVINLDRFEVFFPERRQFFLENSDLFSRFGDDRVNPFFSRRIGVTQDTSTGAGLSNPIYYGARVSGKINNNWRVGLLNMQTDKNEENGLPSYNYTVAAVQRKIFSRSNIGFIFVNKQTFTELSDEIKEVHSEYNRVAGLDYNLASNDNVWNGKAYIHHSFSPKQGINPFTHGVNLSYRVRKFSFGIEERYVGEEYNAEVGFVPRTNYFQSSARGELFFYSKGGKVNRHGPRFAARYLWTPENGNTDRTNRLSYQIELANFARLGLHVENKYTYLLDDFDPSGSDATPLPGQLGYNYTSIAFSYDSDRRKKVFFSLDPKIGQFYNGSIYSIRSNITWRYQPFGQISLTTNYNYIDLPEPYASTGLFLIGPRIDFTFTKKIFLTTFFQYNSQIDNVNINARFQWRFAPVSDFFLVYTDNYNSLDWGVKSRSLVAKLTYWLNL